MKLARYQLVTPTTGAVVLENARQYEANDLAQVDAGSTPRLPTTPAVPEPSTTLLLMLGGGALIMRRARPGA